jgi:hypothetical protein
MAVEAGVHVVVVVAGTTLKIIVVIEILLWTSFTLVTTTAVSINLTTVQGIGRTGLITVASIARSTPTGNTARRKGRSIIAIIPVRTSRSITLSTPILATPAKITSIFPMGTGVQAITAAIVGRRYQTNIQASTVDVIRDTITRRFSATQMAVATREPGEDIADMSTVSRWAPEH